MRTWASRAGRLRYSPRGPWEAAGERSAVRNRIFPEPTAAKVPEIIFLFWVIKVLTTCGGEAVSDYLALGNRQVGAAVETGLLVIALIWQFRTRRYVAAAYWSLAYAIAIFGTGVSDALHLFVGIPTRAPRCSGPWCSRWSSGSGTAARARCRSTAS